MIRLLILCACILPCFAGNTLSNEPNFRLDQLGLTFKLSGLTLDEGCIINANGTTYSLSWANGLTTTLSPTEMVLIPKGEPGALIDEMSGLAEEGMRLRLLNGQVHIHGNDVLQWLPVLTEQYRDSLSGVVLYEQSNLAFSSVPNDYLYHPIGGSNCWDGQTNLATINLPEAWDTTRGDPDVTLAVIDYSFDIYHEDLVGNLWSNPDEIANNGIDDDGNGYLDDIHGWNFQDNNDDVSAISSDPHGTHVAGIALARSNNGKGVAGVAGGWGNQKGASFMALKASEQTTTLAQDGMEALVYAAQNGAHVASISWGTRAPAYVALMANYIDQIEEFYGINIICAAGNHLGDPIDYPAAFDATIAVGSPSSGSSAGPEMDLIAPSSVPTTDPTAFNDPICTYVGQCWWRPCWQQNISQSVRDLYFPSFGGTSSSTPHVAGVVALMLSENPGLSRQQVRNILQQSAANYPIHTNAAGYGMVDADAAVSLAQTTPSLHMMAPNGGESYSLGGTLNIQWDTYGYPGSWVRLELIKDEADIFAMGTVLNITSFTSNSGSFSWSIPSGLTAGKYRVRISSPTNNTVVDYSDRSFEIGAAANQLIYAASIDYPGINPYNPTLYDGQYYTLSFMSQGFVYEDRATQTLESSGVVYQNLFNNLLLQPDGVHALSTRVDTNLRGAFYYRVSYNQNPAINDRTDYFTLADAQMTVTQPSGNQPGSGVMNIAWNWQGETADVDFSLYQNGQKLYTFANQQIPPGAGSYPWTYNLAAGSGYQIQLETTSRYKDKVGFSPVFTVDAGSNNPPTVTINSPMDQAVIGVGTSFLLSGVALDVEDGDISHNIVWTAANDEAELALGVGASLTTSLPQGSWTIDASITDSQGAMATDSVNVTISDQPYVIILTPADGAVVSSSDAIHFTADSSGTPAWRARTGNGRWKSLGVGTSIYGELSPGVWQIKADLPSASLPLDVSDNITITVQ